MSPLEIVGIAGPGINLRTAEILPGRLFVHLSGRNYELELSDDQYGQLVSFICAEEDAADLEVVEDVTPAHVVEAPDEVDGDYSDAWTGTGSV